MTSLQFWHLARMREVRPSGSGSRNSPGSDALPSTRQRCPEIMLISPVNEPARAWYEASPFSPAAQFPWFRKANKERNSSIARAEQDFSRFDSSQLAARTDAFDLRWRQVGNICVPASSTLGVGPEDISPFKNKNHKLRLRQAPFRSAATAGIWHSRSTPQ